MRSGSKMAKKKVYDQEYSLYNKKENYIWLGNKKNKKWAILKPHPKGFLLVVATRTKTRRLITDKLIIPGNYPDDEIKSFVQSHLSIPEIRKCMPSKIKHEYKLKSRETAYARLEQAWKDSNFLENRGKITWKDCPEDFWKWCPLKHFVRGRTHSYKQWWKHYAYKEIEGKSFRGKEWTSFIPICEKPNCLPKWNKVKFEDLKSLLKTTNRENLHLFSKYVSNVYPYFHGVVRSHCYYPEPYLSFTNWLSSCSKSPKFKEKLNLVCNLGIDLKYLNNMSHPPTTLEDLNKVLEYAEMVRKVRYQFKREVTSDFVPPNIKLPEGWVWADYTTFYELSDLYNCCISNSSWYGNSIRRGKACVCYRPDRKENGGGLVFLTYGINNMYSIGERHHENRSWSVHEARGFANGELAKEYQDGLKYVIEDLQETYPTGLKPLTLPTTSYTLEVDKLCPIQLELHRMLADYNQLAA